MSVIISKFVIKIYAIILYINKDGTTLFLQFDVSFIIFRPYYLRH